MPRFGHRTSILLRSAFHLPIFKAFVMVSDGLGCCPAWQCIIGVGGFYWGRAYCQRVCHGLSWQWYDVEVAQSGPFLPVPVCTNISHFCWANNPEGIFKLMMGLEIPKIQFFAQSAFFSHFLPFISQFILFWLSTHILACFCSPSWLPSIVLLDPVRFDIFYCVF